MTHLYYDSKTGNVQRFIDKVAQITGWTVQRIEEGMTAEVPGHLVTFTTNFGKIYSITSSGNRNWGRNYGVAADKLSEMYEIDLAFKFELSGTMEDINQFIDIIKNQYYDSKRRSKKLDIA